MPRSAWSTSRELPSFSRSRSLSSGRLRGFHKTARGNRNRLEAIHKPTGTRGAQGAPAKSVLYTSREIFHRIRDRDNSADSSRADIKRRIEELGNGAKFLQPCAPSEPVHIRGSDDHLDLSTSFVYQSRGLQRTLACADNCNSFPDETAYVSLIRDVRGEFRWQSFERLWPAGKRRNSCGDYDPARLQLLAIVESYTEAGENLSRCE